MLVKRGGYETDSGKTVVPTHGDFVTSEIAGLALLVTAVLWLILQSYRLRILCKFNNCSSRLPVTIAAISALLFLSSVVFYLSNAHGISRYVANGARGSQLYPDIVNLVALFACVFVGVDAAGQDDRYLTTRAAVVRANPSQQLSERVAVAQATLSETAESVRRTLKNTEDSLRDAIKIARDTVDTLENELRTRRIALDSLAAEAESAELRADQARTRAQIDESTAEALDSLLDRLIQDRLADLERAGRAWDKKVTVWSLAASFPVGILAGYVVGIVFH